MREREDWWGGTHGVVGRELVGGRELEVEGGADDFFGLLERVFDLAGCEEGG